MAPHQNKIPDHIWQEIRNLFESGTPASTLLKKYKIPSSTLYVRAKREGWDRTVSTGALDAITKAAKDPSSNNLRLAMEAVETTRARDVLALDFAPPPAPGAGPGSARALESARATLKLVDQTMLRVRKLLQSDQMADETVLLKDRTKALLDLCGVLEKIQKVERVALGLDRPAGADAPQRVVIVVPSKLSEDQWGQQPAKRVIPDED